MSDGDFDLSVKLGDAEFAAAGSSELVMKAFEEFRALVAEAPRRGGPEPAADGPVVSAATAPRSGPSESAERIPFAVFMGRDWPNQAAKAAAILTWAKRYDDKEKLKPGEMAAYWKRVDRRPGNPTMACQRAERQGWLEALGDGFYAVTGYGEKMVDAAPTTS